MRAHRAFRPHRPDRAPRSAENPPSFSPHGDRHAHGHPAGKAKSRYLDGAPKRLLIGGRQVEALSGETFVTINPATGEKLADIALGDARDIDRPVTAARQAFEGPWSRFKPPSARRPCCASPTSSTAEFDEPGADRHAGDGQADHRRARLPRHGGARAAPLCGRATAIHGETLPNSFPIDMLSYTLREPVGVVGAIVPWNGPIFTAVWKCAPVLATGCTVVLKPSEEASLSPLRFGELCLEAGIPEGVVNVVTGYGSGAGAALVEHPDVDKITFTGSSETGRRIIRASADTVKRVTMELGGKSPNIIFADADLDLAVPASAMGVFNNSGQVCSAGSRLYVERPSTRRWSHGWRLSGRGCAWATPWTRDPDRAYRLGEAAPARPGLPGLGPAEGARIVGGGQRLTANGMDRGF
jgi:aldehyde dehydrogenase (NAD+)